MTDPITPIIPLTKTQILRRRALIVGGVAAGLLIAGVAVVFARQPDDSVILESHEDGSFTVKEA